MTEPERPNPDVLLAAIGQEETRRRGKLKICLGAAAGVGKTYSMLQAAHVRQAEGVVVVVVYVETHRRPETEELLPGLEVVPRREEADKISALNLGADDYLTKPFGAGELLAAGDRPGLRPIVTEPGVGYRLRLVPPGETESNDDGLSRG